MHSVQPGRLLPARPEAVSVKTRSGVMPAAAMASCCWSMDCCPVDTRRYAAVLMVMCNNCSPTIHPVSDPGKLGLACDTRKSDSATCTDLMPAVQAVPGPGCLETRHVRAKDKGSSA